MISQEAVATTVQGEPQGEAFEETLKVWAKGIHMRKPGAREPVERALAQEVDAVKMLALRVTRFREHGAHVDDLLERITYHENRGSRIAELLEGGPKGVEQDTGGTPETLARPARHDPIKMLEEKGDITVDHARAARDIVAIYEGLVRSLMSKTRYLNTAGRSSGVTWSDETPNWVADMHANFYLPWMRAMEAQHRADIELVFDLVVDGNPVDKVRRRHHMRRDTLLVKLRAALDLYIELGYHKNSDNSPRGETASGNARTSLHGTT